MSVGKFYSLKGVLRNTEMSINSAWASSSKSSLSFLSFADTAHTYITLNIMMNFEDWGWSVFKYALTTCNKKNTGKKQVSLDHEC